MPVELTEDDKVLAISTFKTDSPNQKTVLFGDSGIVQSVDDNGKGDAWIKWERAGEGWLFRSRWDEDTVTTVVKWNKTGDYGFVETPVDGRIHINKKNFTYATEANDVRLGDMAVFEIEDVERGKTGKGVEIFTTDRDSFAARQGRKMSGRVVSANVANGFITCPGVDGDIFAHSSNCSVKLTPGLMVDFVVGPGKGGHAVQATQVCEKGSGKGKGDGKGKAQKGKAPQGYQPYDNKGVKGKGKVIIEHQVSHNDKGGKGKGGKGKINYQVADYVPPPMPPPQPQGPMNTTGGNSANDAGITKTRMNKLKHLLDEM
eukprot:gene17518-6056_t